MNIQLLPLNKEQLTIIPKWTKDWITSINSSTFQLTTFSCPGYVNYLKFQCSLPWKINATRLVGAYDDTMLLGFVEFTLMESTLFINNIYIKAEVRGNGIARRFLDYAFLLASKNNLSTISLDCFLWNTKALKKYLNWGFKKISDTYWYIGENPYKNSKNSIHYLIDSYPNAELTQQSFGFSNLQIRTNEWKQNVGRISNTYFRIINKNGSIDKNILKVLADLDSNRDLFIISPFSDLPDYPFLQQVSSSARLELVL